MFKIGIGYDVHQLVEGETLIMGGVNIPYEKGLLGHSDADVLIHTIMDAILGALGLGDIGRHFPDTEDAYLGIDSRVLLRQVAALLEAEKYQVSNIDSVIVAQAPKMMPYIEAMTQNIAQDLKINANQINIKATTTEKLGFEGRGEGISAQAVVLLQKS